MNLSLIKRIPGALAAAFEAFISGNGGLVGPTTNDPEMARENDDYRLGPIRIIVETESDKKQLLALSKYLHDLREIDTNYQAVNAFAHLYMSPELIHVEGDPPCSKC